MGLLSVTFKPIPLPLFLLWPLLSTAQNLRGVELGFPEKWEGDRFKREPCEVQTNHPLPEFLDGYFLCQTSAAYGRDMDPDAQRLNHLLDGLGAVASWELNRGGDVRLSGAYYPAEPYKIWQFYDRDMRKSTVAWPAVFSVWNQTAANLWSMVRVRIVLMQMDEIFGHFLTQLSYVTQGV